MLGEDVEPFLADNELELERLGVQAALLRIESMLRSDWSPDSLVRIHVQQAAISAIEGDGERRDVALATAQHLVAECGYRDLAQNFVDYIRWAIAAMAHRPTSFEALPEWLIAEPPFPPRITTAIRLNLATLNPSLSQYAREKILDQLLTELGDADLRAGTRLLREHQVAINRAVWASNDPALPKATRVDQFRQALSSVRRNNFSHLEHVAELNMAYFAQQDGDWESTRRLATKVGHFFADWGDWSLRQRANVLLLIADHNLGKEGVVAQLDHIVGRWSDDGGVAPQWVLDALEGSASILRNTGQSSDGNSRAERARRLRERAGQVSLSELLSDFVVDLLDIAFDISDEAAGVQMGPPIGFAFAMAPTVVPSSLLEKIASMEALGRDGAIAADFCRTMVDFAEGRKDDIGDLKSVIGMLDMLSLSDFGNQHGGALLALSRPLTESRMLDAAIVDLYRDLKSVRRLDREESRAGSLQVRANQIWRLLDQCVDLKRPEAQWEVVEMARLSLSTAPPEQDSLREWLQDVGGTKERESSGPATALSVGGESVTGTYLQLGGETDLQELRERTLGVASAWLTIAMGPEALYWTLGTSTGATGGKAHISGRLRAALHTHRLCLPDVLQADRRVAGKGAPDWVPRIVAIARASRSWMLDDSELERRCLEVLPNGMKRTVGSYLSSLPPTYSDRYLTELSNALLPTELSSLVEHDRIGAIGLSIDHTLAHLPWHLFPVLPRRSLLEEGISLTHVPPVGIATGHGDHSPVGRCGALIADPTGDLPFSLHKRGGVSECLTSWGSASTPAEVANLTNVRALLRTDPRHRYLGIIGHVRPGSRASPSAASLLLAGESPASGASELSARQMLREGLRFPQRVYLGGCAGAGFDTGMEWGSVSAACIALGARRVLAHSWPIVDSRHSRTIDEIAMDVLDADTDVASHLAFRVRELQAAGSVPPHYWAGLVAIGLDKESAVRGSVGQRALPGGQE